MREREIVYMTLRTYYDVHTVVSFHRSPKMERYNQCKNIILDLFGIVYNGNIFLLLLIVTKPVIDDTNIDIKYYTRYYDYYKILINIRLKYCLEFNGINHR